MQTLWQDLRYGARLPPKIWLLVRREPTTTARATGAPPIRSDQALTGRYCSGCGFR
jgi:hypothetical protein